MAEHRQTPTEFRRPSDDELSARRKRNIALAIGLIGFVLFVFFTMISRGAAG